MSAPALALSFFDPGRDLYGQARTGLTLVFEGNEARALSEPAKLEAVEGGWRASLEPHVDLAFEPLSPPIDLGIASTRLCRVSGKMSPHPINGLGVAAETGEPPEWSELESLRTVCALFDPEHALLISGRLPREAEGHDAELVVAALIDGGEPIAVDDALISTTYDRDGRQLSCGVELHIEGAEFPRRAFGTAIAGTSIELEGLDFQSAAFRWRMEGREGVGSYERASRPEPPAAA